MSLTDKPVPSSLCDCNTFEKIITLPLRNFDVKTSLKIFKISAIYSTWTAADFQTDAVILMALQINITVQFSCKASLMGNTDCVNRL